MTCKLVSMTPESCTTTPLPVLPSDCVSEASGCVSTLRKACTRTTAGATASYACAAREGKGLLSSEWRTARSMSVWVISRGAGAVAAYRYTSSAANKAPAATSSARSWRA